MNKTLATALAASLSLVSYGALADSSKFEGAVKDAWIAGKVETTFALSGDLNPFAIDTDVESGVVHLTGAVDSDIDRDLAEELVKGIEGVSEVDNDLVVDQSRAQAESGERSQKRDFGSWVDDATTTAAVKSKLLGNPNTKGLKIDVDTRDDVVTLTGRVGSDEESRLAEQLAKNTGDVKQVRNQLVVDPS